MKTCPDCNGDGVVEKGTDPTCGGVVSYLMTTTATKK